MTLAEAQDEILRLTEDNRQIETLRSQLAHAQSEVTDLQTHNQKLFMRLTHEDPKKDDPENDDPVDLIEFAHKLKL